MLTFALFASLASAGAPMCSTADWFKAEQCEDRACATTWLGPTCTWAVDAVQACVAGAQVDEVSDARSTCREACAQAIGAETCDADPNALQSMTWLALPTCTAVEGQWPQGWQGPDAVKTQVGAACFADLEFMVARCRTTRRDTSDPDADPIPDPSPECLARCGHTWPLFECQGDWTGMLDTLQAWSTAMERRPPRQAKRDNETLLGLFEADTDRLSSMFGTQGLGAGDGSGLGGLFGVETGVVGEGGLGMSGLGRADDAGDTLSAGFGGGGMGTRGSGGGGGAALGLGSLLGSGAGRSPVVAPAPPNLRTVAQGAFDRLTGLGAWVCVADTASVRCFGERAVTHPLSEPLLDLAIGGEDGARWLLGSTVSGLWTEALDAETVVPAPPRLAPAHHVSAGVDFACASVGAATTCWGANHTGQLGDGSRFVRPSPVTVVALPSVDELVSGRDYTCATHANTLRCWGSLFAVGYDPSGWPTAIDLPAPSHLRASAATLCALYGDSGVGCGHELPLKFPGATAFDASEQRVCAVVDGRVACAGLGPMPPAVTARDVAVLREGVCVVDDSTLRCWGRTPLAP